MSEGRGVEARGGGVSRRDALRISAVAGISVAFSGGLVAALIREARLHRVSRTRTRMGTLVTLTVIHPEAGAGNEMIDAAFAEIERLEGVLSRHRPTSALGILNARGVLADAPTELVTVLTEALRLAEATGGAFDPTVLPVLDLYRASYASAGKRPPDPVVDAALRLVGHEQVRLEGRRISLETQGMGVTLDGIAKGFIVDQCVTLLKELGAGRVLVDAGGDIGSAVSPTADEPWTVAVQDPHRGDRHVGILRLDGDAVATSADYQHSFTLDRTVHHILDPRTGRSPGETSSVSVSAPTAIEADGLSTAIMVLGPVAGIAHLEKRPGAEGLVVTKDGSRFSTAGFKGTLATLLAVFLASFTSASPGTAQPVVPSPTDALSTPEVSPLFASLDLLPVILEADFTALEGDRHESPDRAGTLTVRVDDQTREIPVELRTRGAFRLDPANCSFPPLRLDVDQAADAVGTPFEGQDDLKLVSSCRPERRSWEALVLKEYLAYRSVGLVTAESFHVRLLEVVFIDLGDGGRAAEPRLAFLIEDEDALARRLGATPFDLAEGKNLPATAFHPVSRMTNAVAQYMVANPDWSGVAGHNVEILERDGAAFAIPYDFDFSGVVDAPYAAAPPEYRLRSVRERYYRGWCENPLVTGEVLGRFRDAREDVLTLWAGETRLPDDVRADAVRYLEEFFDAIATDERADRRFLRDCRSLPG